jgi:hypothetical protein
MRRAAMPQQPATPRQLSRLATCSSTRSTRSSSSSAAPPPEPPASSEQSQQPALTSLRAEDRARLLRLIKANPSLCEELLNELPTELRRRTLARALAGLEEEFERADQDRDGRISWKEFSTWGSALVKEAEEGVADATARQLFYHFLRSGMPFLGFGFVDNGLMVITGEAIDSTLGMMLGLSTLAAAALGNATSNVIGIGAHSSIERFASSMGIPDPNLSAQQLRTPRVHFAKVLGGIIGVFSGCILGMVPLLFMNKPPSEAAKRADETKSEVAEA